MTSLEQRVAERTADLRESESQLRLTLSAGLAGTWDHDLVSGRSVWSEAHFRLLGLEPTPDGVADTELWKRALVTEDSQRVFAEWARAREARDHYSVEYRIRRLDNGELVYLEDTGKFSYNELGNATAWCST